MALQVYDLAGVTDLDVTVIQVTGRMGLAQRILRRLTTRKGLLLDDESYGDDIRMFIGAAVTESEVRQRVLAQVYAEPDVEEAELSVSMGETIELTIRVVDNDGEEVTLVLAANAGGEVLSNILVT